LFMPSLNPLGILGGPMFPAMDIRSNLLTACLGTVAMINCGLVLGNLLPYYWFDGGYLLQSLLWPFLGAGGALNVTCIIGMVLAVPMFALALKGGSLFGLIFWALLFSSSYTARTQMMPEAEEYAESLYAGSGVSGRIQSGRWGQKSAAKAQAKRRKLEEKIDAILAKVSAQGMNSLTWSERRTLKQGSERLR
jgi:hypothetical protein